MAKSRLSDESRGHGRFRPKPVSEGAVYDLEITETSRRGDGIARVKGFVIFVAGAKQGEKYKVKVVKVARNYAVGEIVPEEGQQESQDQE